MCPNHHRRTTAGSPPDRRLSTSATGLHRHRAGRLLHCGTGVYPLRCIYREDKERLTRSTGYTERYTYDPNNGTRARLPVCNPNPNRIKAKKRVTGVADITVYRSSPPPCVGGKKPHRSTAHDKSKEPNRSSSDLRKEEEWHPNPKT